MINTTALQGILRRAEFHLRTLTRSRGLTPSDKKQLKNFYLERIFGPKADKILRGPKLVNGAATTPGLRLLTARDLEPWLKLDAKTIYQYAQRNLIPHIRIESNVRFREPEIRRWLDRHGRIPRSLRQRTKPRKR